MTKHYYGYYNYYGNGTVDEDGGRIGHLHVFDSKAKRDAWVANEAWDGSYHLEAISSKEARGIMLGDLFCCFNAYDLGYETWGAARRGLKTSYITRKWKQAVEDGWI